MKSIWFFGLDLKPDVAQLRAAGFFDSKIPLDFFDPQFYTVGGWKKAAGSAERV